MGSREETTGETEELTSSGSFLEILPDVESVLCWCGLRCGTRPRVLGVGSIGGERGREVFDAFGQRHTFTDQVFPILVPAFKPQCFRACRLVDRLRRKPTNARCVLARGPCFQA